MNEIIQNLEEQNEQLSKEIVRLKEQMINLYQEFKLNNVSTATEHQMICMQDEIYKKEVSNLKEQNEFLMKRDNILQNLEIWLEYRYLPNDKLETQFILNKIKELEGY